LDIIIRPAVFFFTATVGDQVSALPTAIKQAGKIPESSGTVSVATIGLFFSTFGNRRHNANCAGRINFRLYGGTCRDPLQPARDWRRGP
jgi:hypothetical protein